MIAPEVTAADGVDWSFGDSTLLYDPRFLFPPDELLALALEHARCPGLVHRELRRGMDREDVARLFGLEGVGVCHSGGSTATAGSAADGGTEGGGVGDRGDSTSTAGLAADGGAEGGGGAGYSGDSTSTAGLAADGGTEGAGAGSGQEPAGYFTVEDSDDLEYVLVGTADEVERERRREEGAQAALEAGLNDRVPELLEEAESEVAARKARVDEYTRSRRDERHRGRGQKETRRHVLQKPP